MHLLVYTGNITPRKKYIFDFIFNRILGVSYLLTSNAEDFLNHSGPKISYAKLALGDEIFFKETALLSETGIGKTELSFVRYDGYEAPFAIPSSVFPFDIFAAGFYLLSRYEEYLNPVKDSHGRFEGKSSMAYNKGFLKRAVIDEWAFEILNILKKRFPDLEHTRREFVYQPTLDIDRAYYLKTEKPLRRFLKTGKIILNREWKALINDPFDIYHQVAAWDREYFTKTIFFMLMNNKHMYDGGEDKNSKLFRNLVEHLDSGFVIGLHPSYSSNVNDNDLASEKATLENMVSKGIYISRQHYLKLSLPNTYRNLIKNGIKEDYSMGYADLSGFRASTCSPFLWYDLSEEKETNLLIQPTAVMDQTLRRYMGLTPEDAIGELKTLMQNVKNVKGTFVSLWHNESIGDFGVWRNWKKVYLRMLEMSKV